MNCSSISHCFQFYWDESSRSLNKKTSWMRLFFGLKHESDTQVWSQSLINRTNENCNIRWIYCCLSIVQMYRSVSPLSTKLNTSIFFNFILSSIVDNRAVVLFRSLNWDLSDEENNFSFRSFSVHSHSATEILFIE